MNFNVDYLRMSSPLNSGSFKSHKEEQINFDYLNFRLNAILMTLQAQKEQLQEKNSKEKKNIQQKIQQKEILIKKLQQKNIKLQQECRQLKFNYHQRGSIIDYLKNKIQLSEQKIQNQKQQMMSVITYLKGVNQQLNQKLENLHFRNHDRNQIQTPTNFTSRYSLVNRKRNYPQDSKLLTKRTIGKNHAKKESFNLSKKQKFKTIFVDQKNPFQLKQFWLQGDNIQFQLEQKETDENEILDCTIKNEKNLNRMKSYQNMSPNRQKYKQKKIDPFVMENNLRPIRMNAPIYINNYGHMRISDVGLGSSNDQQLSYISKNRKAHNKTPSQIFNQISNNRSKKNY